MFDDERSTDRQRMLWEIAEEVQFTRHAIGRNHLDPRVMSAMAAVPRHYFVPAHLQAAAYDNGPLPVGHGQTISQPYIVALMTDLLKPRSDHVVLEIGTGCGYQAAVLAQLVAQVHSVEIIPELASAAEQRLATLGIGNISVHTADGFHGWPPAAPYDGIIVTAAVASEPTALLAQLKPGGALVLPLGEPFQGQQLTVLEKNRHGAVQHRPVLPVMFVPFTRQHTD